MATVKENSQHLRYDTWRIADPSVIGVQISPIELAKETTEQRPRLPPVNHRHGSSTIHVCASVSMIGAILRVESPGVSVTDNVPLVRDLSFPQLLYLRSLRKIIRLVRSPGAQSSFSAKFFETGR